MFLLSLLVIATTLIVYRGYRIFKNYQLARLTGLPICFVPFTWQDPIWMILSYKLHFLKNVPGFSWYKYSYLGWSLHDRWGSHAIYGPAYTVISIFGRNEIVLGDNDSVIEVLSKWKKWRKPKELYGIFDLFGDNVNTVPSEQWQRHRKILSVGFREQNNRLVWDAAKRQTNQWLASIRDNRMNLKQLDDDMCTISMDTLMYAGFGQVLDFGDLHQKAPQGYKMSFFAAMRFMMLNLIQAWTMKKLAIPEWFQPPYVKEISENHADLTNHFDKILTSREGDFVKAMHDANEAEKQGGREFLSTKELYGNMFLLQLAGTDTTNNSLVHTVAMLAIHTKYQNWIRETLPTQLGEYDPHNMNVRCLAAMHETVRYYGSAPPLSRYSETVQELVINGNTHIVPLSTYVSCNVPAVSNDPSLWGADADQWRPDRFIEHDEAGNECLRTSPVFVGWSVGPRYCMGKKFSQVEFSAVISTLLLRYDLSATPGMKEVVNDSVFRISPKIRHGERGTITFKER